MEPIFELLQNNLFEAVVTGVFTLVVVSIAFAWGRRKMAGLSESWSNVAQANGLEFASNPVVYDYGDFVGERSWDYPGMVGQFRGRQVQVQSKAGTEGREAGRFILIATVQLKQNRPFTAFAYNRKFNDRVSQRIPRNTKSGDKSLDKAFDIRSDAIDFVNQLAGSFDMSGGFKEQNFRTAQLIFDESGLVFEGATSGYSVKPEQAIQLLDWLCTIADRVDVNPL